MVWAPVPIENAIVSDPGAALALTIAARTLPAPESAVLLTVKVAAWAPGARASAVRRAAVIENRMVRAREDMRPSCARASRLAVGHPTPNFCLKAGSPARGGASLLRERPDSNRRPPA